MAEELDGTPAVEESATSEPAGDSAGGTGQSWSPELQAEYTKKTQALAEERKAWDSQRTQQAQQLRQYAQQVQQQGQAHQQQAQQAQQRQQQSGQQSMVDQLRGMSYLTGDTAAQLVERLVGEGITPIHQQLQQSQQALATISQEYKTLKNQVGSAQGKQAERDLDTRFLELREKHGLPDEEIVNTLMRDVYLSYEPGEELNTKFPDMFGERIDGLRKVFREMDRKAATKAKESPFPSRGGESSLTSGKTGGYKDPQSRADELWPMLNPGQTE